MMLYLKFFYCCDEKNMRISKSRMKVFIHIYPLWFLDASNLSSSLYSVLI